MSECPYNYVKCRALLYAGQLIGMGLLQKQHHTRRNGQPTINFIHIHLEHASGCEGPAEIVGRGKKDWG